LEDLRLLRLTVCFATVSSGKCQWAFSSFMEFQPAKGNAHIIKWVCWYWKL
jgi:hypothetical protein